MLRHLFSINFYIVWRCDGVVDEGARNSQILRRIVREVSSLPASESVTLLDISVKNISRLPGRMFQSLDMGLSGLVISTGSLVNIDKKVSGWCLNKIETVQQEHKIHFLINLTRYLLPDSWKWWKHFEFKNILES